MPGIQAVKTAESDEHSPIPSLERIGFQMVSPFSRVHAYSQIPQPVHLLGSTETNFLDSNFAGDIAVIRPLGSI